ncbi:MAG: M23 family metallopeptidase [Defluviitaleaceae bacterium]|nr:M23 family metallopeptidase [Defluviitaleaceae bacterium]MCL2261826.1 M23 family metallopeptidase [Defluviitaleaceae bacterium]
MRSREIKRRAGIGLRRGRVGVANFGYFKTKQLKEYFFRLCVVAAIVLIFGGLWGLLRPGIRVRVDAETVAAFQVPHRAIGLLRAYAAQSGISFAELFAVFNAENGFFPEKNVTYDLSVLERLYVYDFNRLLRQYNSRSITPYVRMFENLFSEIEVFPIPTGWYEDEASVMFGDSWGVEVNFQGNRTHRGTAIIDRENVRGRVPVVSMTRGTVRDAGWDNQLGYFVGIVTENNTYYLYAHLDSIATGLSAGQAVAAGTHLGNMGNTGGGRSGRSFPVHLHIAISPDVSFTRGNFWLNPYPILRYMENPTGF